MADWPPYKHAGDIGSSRKEAAARVREEYEMGRAREFLREHGPAYQPTMSDDEVRDAIGLMLCEVLDKIDAVEKALAGVPSFGSYVVVGGPIVFREGKDGSIVS